jgi:hypothetical protein
MQRATLVSYEEWKLITWAGIQLWWNWIQYKNASVNVSGFSHKKSPCGYKRKNKWWFLPALTLQINHKLKLVSTGKSENSHDLKI